MKIEFLKINHIQLCIPTGREEEARIFYCGILGLEEISKPADLKKNGGFWLKIAAIELHIGTEDVQNKSKRHPSFEVNGLDQIKEVLKLENIRLKEDKPLPHFRRFSFYDPFNNRIELLEKR